MNARRIRSRKPLLLPVNAAFVGMLALACIRTEATAHVAELPPGANQWAAVNSERQALEAQQRIYDLDAQPSDSALVVNRGYVLFTSGQADLKAAAIGDLNKLVAYLGEYPDRTVVIEGYTDGIGSEDYNQELSQRRAEAVRRYLVGQGIATIRLVAAGKGESAPGAHEDFAASRQQRRRVDIIISDPPSASLRQWQ